jgi:hypothetical protein
MSPLWTAVATARTAQRHLRTVRDLEQRWEALTPEQRAELRGEVDAMRRVAAAVQFRLTYGARGFVNEFKAAKDGRPAPEIDEGRPLAESVADLARAIQAVRAALQRAETAGP